MRIKLEQRLSKKSKRAKKSFLQFEKKASNFIRFLKTLKELKPKQRDVLLQHLDNNSCDILYDTVTNVLNSRLLTEKQKIQLQKKLLPHRSCLQDLSRASTHLPTRKKKISQAGTGSVLLPIISAAIPLLSKLRRKLA